MKFPTIILPKNNLPLTPAKRQYIPQWGEVAPVQPIPTQREGEPLMTALKPYWGAAKTTVEPAVVRTYGEQLVQASSPRTAVVTTPNPYEPSGLQGPSFLGGKFRGAALGQEEEIADLLGEINKLIGKLPSSKAAPLQTKLAACQALVLAGGFFGLLQAVVCLRELYVEAKAAVDKLDKEPTPVPTPTPVVKSEIPWGIVIAGLAGAGILGYLAFKKG